MRKITGKFYLSACLLILAACSNAKENLGLVKKSPDEFAVVKRAPLSMPPDYSLRPPMPGAPRPQEQSPDAQAKEAVFGQSEKANNVDFTQGENALLSQAGAAKADPQIRRKVDSETALNTNQKKPVVKKILGLAGMEEDEAGTVVDAKKESERLRSNKEAGKPVTEGETPSIEE